MKPGDSACRSTYIPVAVVAVFHAGGIESRAAGLLLNDASLRRQRSYSCMAEPARSQVHRVSTDEAERLADFSEQTWLISTRKLQRG